MSIYLGNLSVESIQKRLGVTFPDEIREFMESTRQENVSIPMAADKWHCFDLPFVLYCGSIEVATKIHDGIKHLASDMATSIEIAIKDAPNA